MEASVEYYQQIRDIIDKEINGVPNEKAALFVDGVAASLQDYAQMLRDNDVERNQSDAE